jgi:RNA polymerase sigma-70 factor, ECF subfamily
MNLLGTASREFLSRDGPSIPRPGPDPPPWAVPVGKGPVVGLTTRGYRFGGPGRGDRCPMASDPPGEGPSPDFDDRFAGVVRPMVGYLVRVSRRILGRDDLAWEAVQEALLGLWLQDPPPVNPRAWLIRAAIHRSLHLARTDRRRRKHEARVCLGRPEANDDDDPSRLVLAEEVRGELTQALAKLGDEHRLVLTLQLIDGLDYASIARELGTPIGTVRSRLSRARKALRSLIEGRIDAPGLELGGKSQPQEEDRS